MEQNKIMNIPGFLILKRFILRYMLENLTTV